MHMFCSDKLLDILVSRTVNLTYVIYYKSFFKTFLNKRWPPVITVTYLPLWLFANWKLENECNQLCNVLYTSHSQWKHIPCDWKSFVRSEEKAENHPGMVKRIDVTRIQWFWSLSNNKNQKSGWSRIWFDFNPYINLGMPIVLGQSEAELWRVFTEKAGKKNEQTTGGVTKGIILK